MTASHLYFGPRMLNLIFKKHKYYTKSAKQRVAEKAAPQLLTRPICSLATRWGSKTLEFQGLMYLQWLLPGMDVLTWLPLNRVR
jgi:hypothetical protein